MSSRAWVASLAALAAVRVGIPLVALAASGHDLPALPSYEYEPLNGDANGYHAEARALISAGFGAGGAAALGLLLAGGLLAWRLRRSWTAVAAAALALSLASCALVLAGPSGVAPVVGWPLLWAALMLPARVAGVLDVDVAFALALAASLAANAATVVATAHIGLRATASRAVGVVAAALFAVWPLLVRPLAGPSAWENGQWNVDVGLHLYTEPLSTALVAGAILLLLSPAAQEPRLALAGALLGYATAVKVSNGLLTAFAVSYVLARFGPRRTLPVAASAAAFAPLVAVYWPRGYPDLPNVPSFSLAHAARSWGQESLLYDPRTVAVLLPLAIAGAFALQRECAVLAIGVVLVTAAFYTPYEATHIHPRFFHVTLPALFVLESAGAWLGIRKIPRAIGRGRAMIARCLPRWSRAARGSSARTSAIRFSSGDTASSASTTSRRARSRTSSTTAPRSSSS